MKHCLITAGATREYFDPVRFISNPSSGKMGYALAQAAIEAGWNVDLVSGPVSLEPPKNVILHKVTTGEDMLNACLEIFPKCDLLIKVAAVCDFRPKIYESNKRKKDGRGMIVEFEPVVDILKTLAGKRSSKQTVVGFAAETNDVENYAIKKMIEKKLDLIVANTVGRTTGAFESDENEVVLLGKNIRIPFLNESKISLAKKLFLEIEYFHNNRLNNL